MRHPYADKRPAKHGRTRFKGPAQKSVAFMQVDYYKQYVLWTKYGWAKTRHSNGEYGYTESTDLALKFHNKDAAQDAADKVADCYVYMLSNNGSVTPVKRIKYAGDEYDYV